MKTTAVLLALLAAAPLTALACSSDDPAPATPSDAGTDSAVADSALPDGGQVPDTGPADAGGPVVVFSENFETPARTADGPVDAAQGTITSDFNAVVGIAVSDVNGVHNQALKIAGASGKFVDGNLYTKTVVEAAPLGAKYRVEAKYTGRADDVKGQAFLGIGTKMGTGEKDASFAPIALEALTIDNAAHAASFEFTVGAEDAGAPLNLLVRALGTGATLEIDNINVTRVVDGGAAPARFGLRNPGFELPGLPPGLYTNGVPHWATDKAFSYVGVLRPASTALDAVEPLAAPATGATALNLGFASSAGTLTADLGTPPAGKTCIDVTFAAAGRKDVTVAGASITVRNAGATVGSFDVVPPAVGTVFKDFNHRWSVEANKPVILEIKGKSGGGRQDILIDNFRIQALDAGQCT